MRHFIIATLSIFLFFTAAAYAQSHSTLRIPQISNERVNTWETIIYPGKKQVLKIHRHDTDRVLVALNNGMLKVTNNKGKVHYLKLEKEHSYYLTKDAPGEWHTDENMGEAPVKVLIIELKEVSV